jgi:hypothetical protein
MTTNQHTETGVAGMVGLLGLGHFAHTLADAEPWLASLSYIAAIVVAAVTIYYKFKTRGQ